MSQCRIILENYTGSYYAGSEIRGHLECYFDDETTVRGIKIRLKCKEYNEWLGEEHYYNTNENRQQTRTTSFTGNNEVRAFEQFLYNSPNGSGTLPSGRHIYPFSFILPVDIPSSYNGPYGGIYYKLKGVVDRPLRSDYEDEYNIHVISLINFNNYAQDLQHSVAVSEEKTLCCWCCAKGNVNMDVEIEKLAFVPGIPVNMTVKITNLSNENVENLHVKLEHHLTFRVNEPSSDEKFVSNEVLDIREHGVGANGEHTYELKLEVPSNFQVPNFVHCKLFESSYNLEITAKMPTCTADLTVNFEPELGHVQAGSQPPSGNMEPGFVVPPPYAPNFTPYPPNSTPYPSNPAPYSPNNAGPPVYPPNPYPAEKMPYPSGPPSAPNFGASQASAPEMPPPSYYDVQKPPYPTN